MGFVQSGVLRLWAERIGDPGDPPILLITGAMAQAVNWPDVFVDRLVAGGRQVIRYDHRDTGQSDNVDFDKKPYTVADLAWDALAVLDGFGIRAAHLVGASMGGVIAQGLASLKPERVLTLTAMNTTPIDGGDDLPPPDVAFLRKLEEAEALPRDTVAQRVEADLVNLRGDERHRVAVRPGCARVRWPSATSPGPRTGPRPPTTSGPAVSGRTTCPPSPRRPW